MEKKRQLQHSFSSSSNAHSNIYKPIYTEAVESINGLLGTSDLDPVYHVETSRTFNNPVGANVHSLRKL